VVFLPLLDMAIFPLDVVFLPLLEGVFHFPCIQVLVFNLILVFKLVFFFLFLPLFFNV
jgi:hypothetical protein